MPSKSTTLDFTEFRKWQEKFNKELDLRTKRIGVALSSWADLVVSRAQTFYLTGAALNVQTGRLRSSVKKDPPQGIKSGGSGVYYVEVGSNVWYGKFWELGGNYTSIVTAHQRKINTVFGKAIPSSTVANIGSYSRRVSQTARPWLRPSVEDTVSSGEKLLRKAGVVFR